MRGSYVAIFIILLVSSFLLFNFDSASANVKIAQCNPCPHNDYKASETCGGSYEIWYHEPCCSKIFRKIGEISCSPWQKSKNTGGPSDVSGYYTMAECSCEGECLETPENPRYYDNPTYSDQQSKNIGNTNIKLPVKLDWDDVEGWEQEDGPQSYKIRIENTTPIDPLIDTTPESTFIPPACNLKSNSTHSWYVKACCNADGTNCGDESNWSFNTNIAPEPVSPYDPDWQGSGKKENVGLPTTIDWCDVEEYDEEGRKLYAGSYRFRVYIIKNSERICHPRLLVKKGGEEFCDSWIIREERRDIEQSEKILFSNFFDEYFYFFTRDTTYLWEIATCLDDSGLDCKDFGQQWLFTTEEIELPGVILGYPPHDPNGEEPVGLPLLFNWTAGSEYNSYWYQISATKEFSRVSESRFFDYPELSLNTFYQWKVLPCWDFGGEECEDSWSKTYRFKTTGQPPNLTYPANRTNDILIPVNFNWRGVPGAKSYVFKVSGEGLAEEIVVDDSEFSLNFPEFNIRQEKNYTWQVKTCAWEDGEGACGAYGPSQTFTTFKLSAPIEPSPIDRGQLSTDTKFISWGKVEGAKVYQYQIKYLSLAEKEEDENCPALVGKDLFESPQTASANSAYIELKCLGDYQWQVVTCLDENCQEIGEWSIWSFALVEPGEIQEGYGLVPCGQSINNPNTPWNERESCQIKHIFLMVKIIIDFLLFRLAPLSLVLLTIATGVMFYFSISTGGTSLIIRVKSLWKSTIIGLLIIFFAWTIVNIILMLIGYQISIFGNWYEL